MKSQDLYYLVGDQAVHNQLEASRLDHVTKAGRRFYIYEKQYDSVDWTQEPAVDYDTMCQDRALQLRQKWKKLCLLFSGGSDSSDILRIFLENKIPLDELIIFRHIHNPVRRYEADHYKIPLARWYCEQQPGLTYRVYDITESNYQQDYRNPDWLEGEGKMSAQMGMSSWLFNDMLENNRSYSAEHNVGYINGLEKARLWIDNGSWYMRQIDKIFEYQSLQETSIEFFYLAPDMPEFYVKQCWMLINYLESKYSDIDSSFIQRLYDSKNPLYQELVAGSNRKYYLDALSRTPSRIRDGTDKIKYIDNDPGNQKLLADAASQNWKCVDHYSDILAQLRKNESYLFNQGEPLKGIIGTYGKSYYIKPVAKEITHASISSAV